MRDKFPEQVIKVTLYDWCDGVALKELCFYYNDTYPAKEIMHGERLDTPRTTSRKTLMETLDYVLTRREKVLFSITTTSVRPKGGLADFETMNRHRKAVHNYLKKHNYKIQQTDSDWLLCLSKKDVGEIVLDGV